MGIRPQQPSISPSAALFSGTQQRVLALLFGQPERSFFATELIGLAGSGSGAVQRELKRLVASGLATVRPLGNQRHYQANPQSPIFSELCGIVLKTAAQAKRNAEPVWESFAQDPGEKRAEEAPGGMVPATEGEMEEEYAEMFAALDEIAGRYGNRLPDA